MSILNTPQTRGRINEIKIDLKHKLIKRDYISKSQGRHFLVIQTSLRRLNFQRGQNNY